MPSPGEKTPWRIAIVEDHVLQRKHVEFLLNAEEDFAVVFSGESTLDFVTWLREQDGLDALDLLVLDLMIERRPSVDVKLVESLIRAGMQIVVFSALASPLLVRDIIRSGVQGIVSKRDAEEDIIEAIRGVLRDEAWMTTELANVIAGDPDRPRLSIQEERALVLYASGLTIAEVAKSMNIKSDTAKQYLDRVKAKYSSIGVVARSKLDLSRIAWVHGYSDPVLPRNENRSRV